MISQDHLEENLARPRSNQRAISAGIQSRSRESCQKVCRRSLLWRMSQRHISVETKQIRTLLSFVHHHIHQVRFIQSHDVFAVIHTNYPSIPFLPTCLCYLGHICRSVEVAQLNNSESKLELNIFIAHACIRPTS